MEARAPVRFVWRYILQRVRVRTRFGYVRKVWRKVLRRVSETDVSSSASSRRWDTQSITYADCEAFFEAVSKGSENQLIVMLYETHGREVTEELAKSYNEDGETPLLVAIRLGKLEMVKYLTQKLKVPVSQQGRFVLEGVEYSQVPPLFAAVVSWQIDIIRYLIAAEIQSGQISTSINSIVSSSSDRQQKIDILELLGAVYLSSYQLNGTREPGLLCWEEAMNLRNSTMDGWQVIPKPEASFPSDVAHKSLVDAFEFRTPEELNQLNDHELITQSILVSQRVMNSISSRDDLFSLALLKKYVEICHKRGEYSRVICSTIFFLGYFQQHLWDTLEFTETVTCILKTTTKSFQKSSNGLLDNHEEFTFANLMIAFEFACDYAIHLEKRKLKSYKVTLYGLACNILEMVLLIVEMFPQLNANKIQQFKCSLYRFIRVDHQWGNNGQNLLHMICFKRPWNWMFYHIFADTESDSDNDDSDHDDNSDSSPDSTDDEDVETDGSASGCSLCRIYDDYGSSDNDDDLEVIEVDSDNDDSDHDDNSDSSPDSTDDEDDETDGSASGCSLCRIYDDYGPSDNDDDLEVIEVENLDEEEEDEEEEDEEEEDEEEEDEEDEEIPSSELQLSVIRLFLELGADPNSTNWRRETLLHFLAKWSRDFGPAQVILEHGGHVDQADCDGFTPLCNYRKWQKDLIIAEPRLQALLNNILPLSCLAAKVLRENRVPFDTEIPATLHSFVSRH